MKAFPECLFFLLAAVAVATAGETPAEAAAGTSVSLQVVNEDVQNVIGLYEGLTHQKVILDSSVSVQGKITVTAAEAVSPQQAINLIEKTLFANGFTIVQTDPATVEIAGFGKKPGRVPTISDPKDLPAHERLVSFLFTFKYRNAAEMQKIFAQYLSPPQYYASWPLEQGVNAIWVTERSSIIRRLIGAMEKIDVPETKPSR
jgi:type II secretory pathway component GspD/PulD (secretin)